MPEVSFPSILMEAARSRFTVEVSRSKEDLEAAFRLVYSSYVRAGLTEQRDTEMRVMPYHLLPTTEIFVTKVDQTVTSTMSLIGDGEMGLPMEAMYADVVQQLRDLNWKLAEVGSLADRRESKTRFLKTFFPMSKLLAQNARVRGVDALVAAVHPRHAEFYKRFLGFADIGEQTSCPYAANRPAVALYLKISNNDQHPMHDRYFGEWLPDSEIQPNVMSPKLRSYFAQFIDEEMMKIDPSQIDEFSHFSDRLLAAAG